MDNTERENDLLAIAIRYLAACDALFADTQRCDDRSLGAQVARSALSVAINSVTALDYSSGREIAVTWFERLQSLFHDDPQPSSDLSRTVKWAVNSMASVFPTKEVPRDENTGVRT